MHRFSRRLPPADRFRLGDQLIKSAASIPANIAEGYGRRRRAEYIRFLDIANGSLCELETHFEICIEFGLAAREELANILLACGGIGQMLTRLRRRLSEGRA